jgi:hypothetical protein
MDSGMNGKQGECQGSMDPDVHFRRVFSRRQPKVPKALLKVPSVMLKCAKYGTLITFNQLPESITEVLINSKSWI